MRRRRGDDSDGDGRVDPVEERAAKRRRDAEAIARTTRDLTPVTALERLDALVDKWTLNDPGSSFERQVTTMFQVLGVDFDDDLVDRLARDRGSFGLREVEDAVVACELESVALYHRLHELGLLSAKDVADDGERDARHAAFRKVTKVLEAVFLAKKVVLSAYQFKLGTHQLHVADPSALALDSDIDARLGLWALRFRFIEEDTNDFQRLVLFLLDAAMEHRYRKYGEWMYEPVTVDGVDVHAWRPACLISEFVTRSLPKETCWDMWKAATKSGMKNMAAATEYLTKCQDYQLPTLVKQRGVYSFRNGVYFTEEDRFHCFATDGPLSDQIVACKFFDMTFEPHAGDWRDIPTPHFDGIPRFQEWDDATTEWLFVFAGRLLYAVGELDGWQVTPFFKGVGSSGKSTLLLKVFRYFYEAADVGILSNNIERTFGISAFHDKYLVLGPEIRSDFKMDQAEYQSMSSGEAVQVNVKHQTARAVDEWRAPIAFAGNEVPDFADSGGAVQRRTPVFNFAKPVVNGDMKLGDKLFSELPAIVQKANKAYLEKVRLYAHVNVWTVLPASFHANRKALARDTNPLVAFLDQPEVQLGADRFVSLRDFRDRLKEYVDRTGGKMPKLIKDTWQVPFDAIGVSVRREKRRRHGGPEKLEDWVVGLDFAADDMTANVLM